MFGLEMVLELLCDGCGNRQSGDVRGIGCTAEMELEWNSTEMCVAGMETC